MALVNFKKGTQSDYNGAVASYANYIYVAEDTRNVYLFGVLQQGISDEDYAKLDAFDDSVKSIITSLKNVANGIAGLDESGLLPSSILPGSVDEIIEANDFESLPPTGEKSKIYVTLNDNKTYRWSGSAYVEISASIALGETTSTAYEGSKGAANRAALDSMMNTVVTGFGAVTPNATQISIAFNDADKTAGTNVYAAGDGGTVIIPAATNSAAGLMSAADKTALDALAGDGEGSLEELSGKVDAIETTIGETTSLTTDAKDSIVNAINEVDSHANTAQSAVDALSAAAVKQVKVGSGEALNPTAGLITIANASTSADGAMSKEDKAKLDKVLANGDGSKFLADDGTYKEVPMNLSEEYAKAESVDLETEPAAGDSFETAISKLHKAASDNKTAIETANTNFQTVLGVNGPNMTMPDLSGTNYLNGQTLFVAALKALDTALKTVADQAAQITDLTSRVVALETALTLKIVGA